MARTLLVGVVHSMSTALHMGAWVGALCCVVAVLAVAHPTMRCTMTLWQCHGIYHNGDPLLQCRPHVLHGGTVAMVVGWYYLRKFGYVTELHATSWQRVSIVALQETVQYRDQHHHSPSCNLASLALLW